VVTKIKGFGFYK